MAGEQIDQNTLKEILIRDHGVVFYPKRELILPVVDPDLVEQAFGLEMRDPALETLANGIRGYAEHFSIGDKFGSNLTTRKIWRINMYRKYGQTFKDVYEKNQFRGNKRFILWGSVLNTERRCIDPVIKARIGKIKSSITIALHGYKDPITGEEVMKKFEDLGTDRQRLAVTRFLDNRCVDILRLFAR